MHDSLKRPLVWQKKTFSLVFSHSAMQIINNKVTNNKSPSTVMVFMHTKQKIYQFTVLRWQMFSQKIVYQIKV